MQTDTHHSSPVSVHLSSYFSLTMVQRSLTNCFNVSALQRFQIIVQLQKDIVTVWCHCYQERKDNCSMVMGNVITDVWNMISDVCNWWIYFRMIYAFILRHRLKNFQLYTSWIILRKLMVKLVAMMNVLFTGNSIIENNIMRYSVAD